MNCNTVVTVPADSESIICFKCKTIHHYNDYNKKSNHKRILEHLLKTNSEINEIKKRNNEAHQMAQKKIDEFTRRQDVAEDDKKRAELREKIFDSLTEECNQDDKNEDDIIISEKMLKFMRDSVDHIPKFLVELIYDFN